MYERISPTAEHIAFLRAVNSQHIPYAKVFADLCDAEKETKAFYHRADFDVDLERMKKMAHWATLRYMSLREAVRRTNICNVFELAAGFSPAGFDTVTEDPRMRYLETDLPETIVRRQAMEPLLWKSQKPDERLGLAVVDALNGEQMLAAAKKHFAQGPLVVVHEGLLQYLTHEEKLQVAKNIATVLRHFGGVWMTSDIVLKAPFVKAFETSDYNRRIQQILAEGTGRDMADLAFDSFAEAEVLLKQAGFTIRKQRQVDLTWYGQEKDLLHQRKNLELQHIWCMKLK